MDGKIFSFDLQRFDNAWSLVSDPNQYQFGESGSFSLASLSVSDGVWSLTTGGTSGTVSIDASTAGTDGVASLVSSINGTASLTKFDAHSATLPFYFKFASSTPITSITGGSGGASIDASALNKSGTFHLDGGTGADSLVAGSSKSDTFYLNGGSGGADTLVGGNGVDYFIFGGNGTTSISGFTANQDFISLTSDAALPGATSVKAVNDNDLALYFGTGGANSLLVENVKDSAVTVIDSSGTKYYYSKDYIASSDYEHVSLTSNGSDTFTALSSNFSTKAVTIDAQAASVGSGVSVTLNNKNNYFIGSSSGNSITDGSGSDTVSLGGGADLFKYAGGADSIVGFGTGTDSIKLNASKLSLVTDGTKLASLSGQEGFELTFGTGNTLTFKGATTPVSVYDSNGAKHYDYTSTAISLAGSGTGKGQVTLGKDYNDGNKFEDSNNAFSIISAAAVSVTGSDSNAIFSISGGSTASSIYGSDKVFTSITGGTANDTLQAGAAGASLNGNGGNDLLIGSGKQDYFYFSSGTASIKSYTYDTDVVTIANSLTAPTSSFGDSIKYGGSDFVVSLGGSNALTFKATQKFELAQGSSLYTYAPGSVALQYAEGNKTIQGVTIGGSYYKSKSFNGASEANADYVTINASEVNHKITVRGNDNANYLVASSLYGGTLLGGLEQDTLVAGSVGAYMDGQDGDVLYIGSKNDAGEITDGKDTFVYSGNAASIQNYGAGDIVNFTASDITINAASVSAASVGDDNDHIDLTLKFDDSNKIIFQSLTGTQADNGVSLKSGSSNLYVYKKDSVTWNDKSITLTADYAGMNGDSLYTAAGEASIVTIDAHLVGKSITPDSTVFSIAGNGNANYIIGSASRANSISGGAGNDTIIGNTVTGKGDVFHYTAGDDVILGFDGEDKFSIGGSYNTDKITKAKAGRNKLTFTIDKENSIAFRSYESTDAPARISLDGAGGGFLTKDGVAGSIESSENGEYSLKLFGSAKGTIDLTDTLYSDTKITSVNAEAASSGLTLVAKSVEGTAYYNFKQGINKRDTFVYDAGAVSITGFESGKDRLNIADDTITSFSISGVNDNTKTGGTVIISLNGGDGSTSDIISLSGAQGNEILVRQNGARGYSKMVFRDSGVLENKTKNPTSVTLSTGAASYSAVDNSVKKMTVTDIGNAISIYAGSQGSIVDASNTVVGAGVSLIGNAKADKFTGSSGNTDTFVYNTDKGGKDIFNSFVAVGDGNNADSIEFSDGGASLLSGAKISASNKAVKFKFGTKNVLTLKGDNLKDAKLQIDGTKYTYGKNSIADGSNVSLTSKFGGTYKVAGDVNYVDAHLVEKKLTVKGTTDAETIVGGANKTLFKGAGGADSLVGGSGDDIFFYAKGDNGTAHIANFDFKNDKLKIASGTLRKIETIDGGGISFNMSTKNDKDDPVIGYFNIESSYDKSNGETTTTTLDANKSKQTLIHANNRYYWFAQENFTETVTTAGSSEGETIAITAGDLIGYSDKNISSSQAKDYAVIELNYGTNLVKSGVATLVSSKNDKATLPSAT